MKIIAEVGSNWKTLDDCLNSVVIAKNCGADAVKFQYFTNEDLYGMPGPRECKPDVHAIKAKCDEVGIEFMCTAFSPAGYLMINPLVKTHKIASSEITAIDILEIVNVFQKPVILSTGGATDNQIARALAFLKDCEVTILYCVVAYPARTVNLHQINVLRARFPQYEVGYSDHSTDVLEIPVLAKKKGAKVIEKHVNFTEHTDTPDAPHSLNEFEFRNMVRALKDDFVNVWDPAGNPYQRQLITLPDGRRGYFRPLVND